jgi:hypothetical protein
VDTALQLLTTLTAFTALLGRWDLRRLLATLCLVQRLLAVLHEHNLLQSTIAPSHCKAVLMLQDALVQQAPRSSSKWPSLRWPRNANSRCWNCPGADLESPSDWLHRGLRSFAPPAPDLEGESRLFAVMLPTQCLLARRPPKLHKQHAVIPTAHVCIPSAHCRRCGGCARCETPMALRRSRSSGSSIQGPPTRLSPLSAPRGF